MKDKNSILIVDDDIAHCTILHTLLKWWGYEVCVVDENLTATNKVKKQPFDLVLMDIRMVKIAGLEALDRIQLLYPTIRVITMADYSSIDIAIEALKNGAYDYIIKPIDYDMLRFTIEKALETENASPGQGPLGG
jgi:two-component system response regulator HydG